MIEDFTEKVVVISGASRGLGRALAIGFAKRKAMVAICASDRDRLSTVVSEVEKIGARCISMDYDISNEASSEKFIGRILQEFRHIDVLINNASVLGSRTEISSYPTGVWQRVIDINLSGTFYLTKYALQPMLLQQDGSIINVSSSVGRSGRRNWGAYAVSKFGIEGFTQVLSQEVKDKKIRVNAVNPGALATDMRREAFPDEDQSKLKKPEEILDIFFYLASDDSLHCTGQTFEAQQFHR